MVINLSLSLSGRAPNSGKSCMKETGRQSRHCELILQLKPPCSRGHLGTIRAASKASIIAWSTWNIHLKYWQWQSCPKVWGCKCLAPTSFNFKYRNARRHFIRAYTRCEGRQRQLALGSVVFGHEGILRRQHVRADSDSQRLMVYLVFTPHEQTTN